MVRGKGTLGRSPAQSTGHSSQVVHPKHVGDERPCKHLEHLQLSPPSWNSSTPRGGGSFRSTSEPSVSVSPVNDMSQKLSILSLFFVGGTFGFRRFGQLFCNYCFEYFRNQSKLPSNCRQTSRKQGNINIKHKIYSI